jgi:hypothetical protein
MRLQAADSARADVCPVGGTSRQLEPVASLEVQLEVHLRDHERDRPARDHDLVVVVGVDGVCTPGPLTACGVAYRQTFDQGVAFIGRPRPPPGSGKAWWRVRWSSREIGGPDPQIWPAALASSPSEVATTVGEPKDAAGPAARNPGQPIHRRRSA